jgi:hypothetical protein
LPKSELQVVISHDEGKVTGSLGLDGSSHPNLGYVFFFSKKSPGRRFLAVTDENGHFSQALPPDQYYLAAYKSFDYTLLDDSSTPETRECESVEVPAGGETSVALAMK